MRRVYLLVIGVLFSGIAANCQYDFSRGTAVGYGAIAGTSSMTAWRNNNNTDDNLTTPKQMNLSAGSSEIAGDRGSNTAELKMNFDCQTPTAITVVSTTSTTATVSFTSAGNNFIVEYGAPGFTPGVDNNPGAGGTIVLGTSSPITIPSLSPSATYDVYVREVCVGPAYSANSTLLQVTTLCTATNTPYLEDFESLTAPGVPGCIRVQDANADATTWMGFAGDASTASSGSKSMAYFTSITNTANDWFFTRGINLVGGTSYRLQFKYKASQGPEFVEKLEVKYGSTADASSMTAGTLFINTNIDNSQEDPFLTGAVDFTPSTSGVYYLGFHAMSDADQKYLIVDDISVDATAACPAPIGVSVVTTGASSASVSFSSPGNNFVVEYGAPGFTPGTNNSPGTGGTVVTGTSSPITITGLTGGPTYDVYVRQSCGGASYSVNTGVIRFMLNDEAVGAKLLTLGAGCTGATETNQSSSLSAGEFHNIQPQICSGTSQSPVWYKFVAPASGAVRVSTDGGSGNTLTDSKIALFSTNDPSNYASFNIVSCDDDGGSNLGAGFMSVMYATGLTVGQTYYIMVDRYDHSVDKGTFCITVDELNNTMIASASDCNVLPQQPFSNGVTAYKGWLPLITLVDSKLVALVRNTNGMNPESFDDFRENINIDPVRTDATSGQKYLDRSFMIHYIGTNTNPDLQLFFLTSELNSLHNADSATLLSNLGVTRQTTTGANCQPDFVAINGTNSYLPQTSNGTSADGLVKWVSVTTPGFSNFYLHTSKAPVTLKTFLQGAYASAGSHKNVTPAWLAVLQANATNQPYNVAPFNYPGTENVPAATFTATASGTDIIDWVLVELRDPITPSTIIARRAAFILVNGSIVDLDKTSSVAFRGVSNGSYYVTIRHRNHLDIRTALVRVVDGALGSTAVPSLYDFSALQSQAYQNTTIAPIPTNAAMKDLGSGVFGMWGGNVNSNVNTIVNYTGLNNDALAILGALGSNQGLNLTNVYNKADVNLSGNVNYTGLNNDALSLLGVLGGNQGNVIRQHIY